MRLLPRSLTWRLVITAVGLVALVSLMLAAVTTVLMQNYLVGKLDQRVIAIVRPSGDHDDRGGRDGDRGPLCGPGPNNHTLVATLAGDGGVLTDTCTYSPLSPVDLARLKAVPTDGRPHNVELRHWGHYRVLVGQNKAGDQVAVGLPMTDIGDTIDNLLWLSLVLAGVGVALAAGLGSLVVRRQLRPLRQVAATAFRVSHLPLAEGDQSTQVRVPAANTDPRTEVGQVGSALNTLLDHVDAALGARHRSEQQVRQFVADASHELRTPLATIHGYAELSRRTSGDPEALSAAMTKVETEADRMSSLVEDLLLLARLDSGRPLERAEVDLTRLLLETTEDAKLLAPEHTWRLDLPDDPIVVTGDAHRLHQVISNLVNNARRHTPPRTTVTVGAAHESRTRRTTIWVRDNGPGIPDDLIGHIFERFTRGDSSRTRASGGAGLGLSLVQAIVSAHRGHVEVTSAPGDTTFTVTLPDDGPAPGAALVSD